MYSKYFNKNRIFFFFQNLLKYSPLTKTRSFIYSFFFQKCGKNVVIQDGVTIKYPDEIILGDNVSINQGCFLVGLGGLKIGNNVRIAAGCKIVTTSHKYDKLDIPIHKQGLIAQPIQINDDAWIGFDVIVLGNSIIGKGSIVGAKSFIKDKIFDEYCIIGGVPARVIKMRAALVSGYYDHIMTSI